MTLFPLEDPTPPRWHFGFRYQTKRGYRWVNNWLEHPSPDLVLPFEVGSRALYWEGG